MTATTDELRVMSDFGMYPVWLATADGVDNVDPAEVLSEPLAARLDAWSERYEAIYDEDYPPDSAFVSPEAEQEFVADGRALAHDVAREVGSRYGVVRYYDRSVGGYVTVDGSAG